MHVVLQTLLLFPQPKVLPEVPAAGDSYSVRPPAAPFHPITTSIMTPCQEERRINLQVDLRLEDALFVVTTQGMSAPIQGASLVRAEMVRFLVSICAL